LSATARILNLDVQKPQVTVWWSGNDTELPQYCQHLSCKCCY